MKDEIKEILDYIDDRIIPNEKWNKIKDYITNLQEENERLTNARYSLDRVELEKRINKAIEYIENDMPYLEEPDDDYENNHKMIEYDKSILLNILQGEDKDE